MKIKCELEILNSSEDKLRFFSGMISHKDSHSLDLSNIQEIINHKCLSEVENTYIKRLAVSSANRNYEISISISNESNGIDKFHSSELNAILSRKAVVILENSISDGLFIDAVIKSQQSNHLLQSKDISWETVSAGGCGEIPKHISALSAKMKGLKRVLVVHDSDRIHPDSEISEIQHKIIETAENNNVLCCTLEKREIENYIPDSVISKIDVARKRIIDSFSTLSESQKDYFDYKSGFKRKGGHKRKDDASFNGLFDDIPDNVYNVIKNGFGKDISELAYEKELLITKDDFNTRCDKINKEFEKICAAIERIL
jgi:hypothetical protein